MQTSETGHLNLAKQPIKQRGNPYLTPEKSTKKVPRVHQKPGTEVIEHAKAIGKDKTRVCKDMKKIKLEYAKKSMTARQDIGTNNGSPTTISLWQEQSLLP